MRINGLCLVNQGPMRDDGVQGWLAVNAIAVHRTAKHRTSCECGPSGYRDATSAVNIAATTRGVRKWPESVLQKADVCSTLDSGFARCVPKAVISIACAGELSN